MNTSAMIRARQAKAKVSSLVHHKLNKKANDDLRTILAMARRMSHRLSVGGVSSRSSTCSVDDDDDDDDAGSSESSIEEEDHLKITSLDDYLLGQASKGGVTNKHRRSSSLVVSEDSRSSCKGGRRRRSSSFWEKKISEKKKKKNVSSTTQASSSLSSTKSDEIVPYKFKPRDPLDKHMHQRCVKYPPPHLCVTPSSSGNVDDRTNPSLRRPSWSSRRFSLITNWDDVVSNSIQSSLKSSQGKSIMYHVLDFDFDLNASEENDNPTPLVMTKRRHRKSVHKVLQLQDDERSDFTTSLDKLELLCSAADCEKRRVTKRSDSDVTQF